MPILNFPLNPTVGQTYTIPGTSTVYTWNGAAWIKTNQGNQNFGNITGGSATIGTNSQTAVIINQNGNLVLQSGSLRVYTTATIGNVVISTSSVINTLGNLTLQGPKDTTIVLNNDTLVNGNLHATGNITANGSVQIGNMTGSDTLSLFADIVSNITPQTPNQYDIGNPQQTWRTGYFENLVANNFVAPPGQPMNIGGRPHQDINVAPVTNPTVNINGPIRVWGDNPLGTGPVVSNVLYVSMDGSDTNDGRAADASRACRTITGAVRSPYYKEGTSIKVAPGHYYEDNPIELKPYTSVIGSDLRTTSVEPINKTQDLFHVQSGCYLNYMQFTNGQSGLLPGPGYNPSSNRGAYATAFPPNYGGQKIDVFHSPYIQNCTNQSGPWLYDGTMFQPNQTVQVPEAVGTATWTLNTTTMIVYANEGTISVGQSINVGPTPIDYVNARTLLLANKPFIQEQVIAYVDQNNTYYGYDKTKCMRDTGLIIDSLVSDLLFGGNGFTQSNFAGLQYWNQNGYTGQILNELTTTTAAINYVSSIVQDIIQNNLVAQNQLVVTQDTSTTPATLVEAQYLANEFTLITSILNSGTSGITDIIVPNGITARDLSSEHAVTILQTNKAFIQAQAVSFVESTRAYDFVYDQAKCYRDVGYMIDCVCFDLLYGGNRQAIQAGVYYYGFSGTASAIPTERPQTTAAYYRIREILNQLLTNQSIVRSPGNLTTQVTNLPAATDSEVAALKAMVEKITEIINGGPDAADAPTPITTTKSSDTNVLHAADILRANKGFITSEVISYIDQTYNNGFVFNQPKCSRDTGLIVDSIAVDLLYNGSTQSTFAGLQYWNQNGYTGQIPNELTTTSNAIKYVSSLAQQVITNTTGTRYQNTVTQFVNTRPATASEVATVSTEFDLIDSIILNGTAGVTDLIVPNGTASTASNIVNAYTLLQANKTFIQTEAVAYVNSLHAPFNQSKCSRDTGLIVDAIAQDLVFGGTSQSTFSGLQYWNQAGYTGAIASELTTTTNAINYVKSLVAKILVNDVSGTRYSDSTQVTNLAPATSSEVTTTNADFDIILNIITTGTSGVTDIIVPNSLIASTSTTVKNGVALLEANKAYIQAEAVAFVEATKTIGYVYNQSLCARDVGYMIDSVAFDLLYSGNRQAVQSGVYYYGFSNTASAIPTETPNTLLAYSHLKEIIPYIIEGVKVPQTYQSAVIQDRTGTAGGATQATIAQSFVDIITTIINDGPSAAGGKVPITLTPSPSSLVINAANQLHNNRAFIVAEVVAFINSQNDYVYDQEKCYRDVGYMIDSVSFDLIHGGNRQAIHSGVYYYSFNANSTAIPNEIPQTVAAYDHIRNIVGDIITGVAITPTNGNTATQITTLTPATSTEIALAYNKIDVITNIINNGPSVANTATSINLTAVQDNNIIAAYNMLLANREFIQAEVIAYVSQFSQGFVYNRAKCKRDVGIIVENIAYDIAFGGNQKSVESGVAYWNGVVSVIPGEISTTTNAITYLGTLAKNVISNITATNLLSAYQTAPQIINTALISGSTANSVVDKLVGLINDIITNGIEAAPTTQVGNGPDWGSVSAEVLLQANRKFIQSEIVNWVNNTFPDFVYNEALCYRDTGLIIDAISQDIILNSNAKTIEAAVTYWTGNVNAVAGEITQTVAALNRAKQISLEIINNTTVTATSFVFNPVKCSRDTGLIVDALAQDLLFGGNSQSTFAGIQYWNHDNYVGNISNEITTTTAAINYLKSIAQKVLINDTSGVRYQNTLTQVTTLPAATSAEVSLVGADFDVITNILTTGTTGVTDIIVPNNIVPSANANVQHGYDLLQANKEYMQAEVIAWIEENMRFRYDQTKCARDSGLIVDSIALDLAYPSSSLSQSTFSGLQYWNQAGYTGAIASELTTTTNAINYVKNLAKEVIQNITSGERHQASITQVTNANPASNTQVDKIESEFTIITNILSTGTAGVTDMIVSNDITPSADLDINAAYTLLQLNREYIQAEAVAYVEYIKSAGYTYDQTLCLRDVGYMLDSVSFDLLHGGNRQAIQSGVYYYTFDSTSTAIPNEVPQTVAAFEFIKVISEQIAQNITVTPLQNAVTQLRVLPAASETAITAIDDAATRIINIIENGPTVVGIKEPINLTQTTDQDRLNAASNLIANKEFIKAETIAYLNSRYAYQYDRTKCSRDVGYMVDSVSFDLLYSGNRQAVQSGVYYWGYNNQSTSLPSERVASTNAYNYMKELITEVVTATPATARYQNSIPQITNLPPATSVEVADIAANIDLITTIINAGPTAAPAATNIPLTRSINEFVNNAANLLAANRDFIRAEVIGYINNMTPRQVFLPFYDKGANATLSVIRNFEIISNVITNGVAVAPVVFEGNGIFVKSGLSRDNIPYAPTVTSVTPLGGNVYEIDISESTVGYGDGQTLYFGTTAVYPLLDADVPDRWQQRRLNPIGSMGGSLVDGGVVSDRSPITSFVYDAFTQVNQGGNGIFITNNGYAQLVSVFTIFCSNAVTVQNGGIASITNSNSNFGDICLAAKGYGKREFSGYVKNPPVAPYFPNGIYPQNGEVVIYIADPQLRPHIALVMEVEPPVGHTNNQGLPGFLTGNTNVATLTTGSINITGVDTTGVVIGQSFYVIDQYGRKVDSNNQPYVTPGTIVADVSYQTITLNYPLNSGGGDPNNSNYFNLYTCGNAYYTVLSSTVHTDPVTPGTLLLPGLQGNAEVNAINYLNSLTQKIISNQPVTPLQTATTQVLDFTQSQGAGAGSYITNELSLINSILNNGPDSAPTITKSGPIPAGTVYADAAGLLASNRTFLQDEIIQYVDNTFRVFIYDQDKCYRDTGLIVDAIAQDLVFGGTSQSTFAGIQYWNQSGYVGAIANELTTTTNAINYVSQLAQQVVQNITDGTRYQSAVSQVSTLTTATITQANNIASDFNVILNILTNGTAGVTDIIVPNSLTPSSDAAVQDAYALLQANKAYIQAEAIAYINETNNVGFNYNQDKCARDTGLIVDAIVRDMLFNGTSQSAFAGVQYWNHTSYVGAIAGELTTTTNAINYVKSLAQKIIVNDTSGLRYQSGITQNTGLPAATSAEQSTITTDFNVILNILSTGTAGITDMIVSNGITASSDLNVQHAYALLQANKAYIEAEAVAFVENTKTAGFTYDQGKCSRDVGYMIDSVCFDLLYSGNSQAVQSGVYYYGYNSSSTAIPNEIAQSTAAYNHIKTLIGNIVTGTKITAPSQVSITQITTLPTGTASEAAILRSNVDIITNVINNGPSVAPSPTSIGLTPSSNANVLNAAAMVEANRAFIVAEVIAYINETYFAGFTYDQAKCYRDVGYMIDSVSIDLLYGGNRQAVQSGVYYFGYSGTSSAISGETEQTKAAYNHIRSIISDIIVGTPLATTYQTAVPQVIPALLGSSSAASVAQSKVDVITNIIANGPKVAASPTPLGLVESPDADVQNSGAALEANRAFIQAETIAYINATFGSSFTYNSNKCARDTGLIVDALAQDLLFSTSSQATFAGIQYWNQDGYTGAIASELTTTTSAVNFVSSLVQQIIQNDTSGIRYTGGTQITGAGGTVAEADTVAADFAVITNILTNGTAGVTNIIVPNGLATKTNINIVNAYELIQLNKTYIQDEAVAFVENYKATYDPSFVYDQTLCRRDVGYMVDSVSFDLLYGGNRQAVQSGVYYWNYNAASTAVPNERVEVTAAYEHIKSIAAQIILGEAVTTYQSVQPQVTSLPTGTLSEVAKMQTDVNLITNIINNGPSVVTAKTPISLTRSTDQNVINAATILEANRQFIVAETIAYVNRVFGTYNKEKCRRDVGLIVDALTYDLAKGGNYNAIIAGRSYYAEHGTHHLVQLEDNVTDPGLFPDGAIINFYQRSYMSASGYLFEYVGAGTNYGALPQVGVADPVQSKETVQLNNGKVFFTSTDQNGDFRIGTGLVISQATGVLSGRTFTKSLFANLTPFILAIEGI